MASRVPLALLLLSLVACGGQHPGSTSSTSTAEPAGPALSQYCLTPQDHPQPVRFAGMNGEIVGSGSTGVVIANESGNDVCPWQPLVRRLLASGRYRLLLYFFTSGDDIDAAAAAAALHQHGAGQVALVGASVGGAAVIVAGSSLQPPPLAVVSLSGEQRVHGMNALAAAPRLRVPTLILAAEEDPLLNGEQAKELVAAAGAPDNKLVLYPGTQHGTDYLSGDLASRSLAEISGFLDAHATVAVQRF